MTAIDTVLKTYLKSIHSSPWIALQAKPPCSFLLNHSPASSLTPVSTLLNPFSLEQPHWALKIYLIISFSSSGSCYTQTQTWCSCLSQPPCPHFGYLTCLESSPLAPILGLWGLFLAPGIISSRSSHSRLLIQLPASTSPPFKRIFLTLDGFPVISSQIPGIFHQDTYPCQIFESCLLDSTLVCSESRGPVCRIKYSVLTVQEMDQITVGTIILLKEGTNEHKYSRKVMMLPSKNNNSWQFQKCSGL